MVFGRAKKNDKKSSQKAVKFHNASNTDNLVADGYQDMFPRERGSQVQPTNEEVLPPPPGTHTIDETEAILLKLHGNLVEFYARYKPENLDEDVLTILMQFCIDGGQDALNAKLKKVYGEDLNTFQPLDNIEPPPPYMSTLERKHNRHRSLFDRTLPPPPKTVEDELSLEPPKEEKKPAYIKAAEAAPPQLPPPPTQRFPLKRQESDILGLNGADPPPTISSQKLAILDNPDFFVLDQPDQPLSSRDLLEAFYFLHDETKLTKSDDGIEKFVIWSEKHSLGELSDKLKAKYGQSLDDVKGVALRRRNLEDTIIAFYTEHDQSKLGTRYTILKIVNWTMKNGLRQLNDKFEERYGSNIVKLPPLEDDDDDDELLNGL